MICFIAHLRPDKRKREKGRGVIYLLLFGCPCFSGNCIYTKTFFRAVNSKRYNTLDFHGKSCATKPTVSDERGVLSKRTSNQSFSIAKSDWQQNQLSLDSFP